MNFVTKKFCKYLDELRDLKQLTSSSNMIARKWKELFSKLDERLTNLVEAMILVGENEFDTDNSELPAVQSIIFKGYDLKVFFVYC